ncbi:MAG: NAD(P)/FAD-dependent oxidoreductase [Acidobacteriota bacterium]
MANDNKKADIVIVGGGPAGLAVAIEAASRGFVTLVLERSATIPDKACGEGLMPAGVRLLEKLGARHLLDPNEYTPFIGIRYLQEDGSSVEARFRAGEGLGIRRIALVDALTKRAREVGAEVRQGCIVKGYHNTNNAVVVTTNSGALTARLLVAADGLGSPLRRAAGLDLPPTEPRRFGLRRHFHLSAWSPFVEVYWAKGVEAYITPSGRSRVGIAFLWNAAQIKGHITFETLLANFPMLATRLTEATPDSQTRGAGPFARTARAHIADRFVLIGDAAGYVDAITGEGISLAFACAAALGRLLPDVLAQDACRSALAPYEQLFARVFQHYSLPTRILVAISQHPQLRRRILQGLAVYPRLFEKLLDWASLPMPIEGKG